MVDSKHELQSTQGKAPSRTRVLFPAIVLSALAVAVVFLAVMGNHLQNLERRLDRTSQRATAAEQEADRYARESAAAQARARAAQEQAQQAQETAAEKEAARLEAESETQRVREQSEVAHAVAEQALAARRQAREELEQIRQRREEELNRMQQALNRVAPTRRTPTGMVMELANDAFRFDFDSATLRPENREMLSRIAGILLASEGYRLFIDGHTDDIGTKEYNQGLSERRAQSVRQYLVKAGLPAEIISTHGFGKSNPLVEGKTREARQKNRRVEIGIVDTIIDYKGEVAATEKNR